MAHSPAPAFAYTGGSPKAKILLVAEAWGQNEDLLKYPLVGWSGLELARVLHESGIVDEPAPSAQFGLSNAMLWHWWRRRTEICTTNVFSFRPDNNKIESLCVKRADVAKDYSMPAWKQGEYVREEYLGELDRLKAEIDTVQPNLIVALGNTACWALLRSTKISALRGSIQDCVMSPGIKVLPTYHPASVLYNWPWRVVLSADMIKARSESLFPEIRRPERYVLVNPTLVEATEWTNKTLAKPPPLLSIDTETKRGQIEMVGFSPRRDLALVIPFIKPNLQSYWPTVEDEIAAWRLVEKLCASDIPKLFQNGLYDLQYFIKARIRVLHCLQDTLLLHHSMFPELPKSLSFLGSVYSSESSWKLLRDRADEELKRDD